MNRKRETLYQTLGVKRTATQQEIKNAYRAQALKYHPDKCTEGERSESTKAFQNINNAFSVLSNEPEKFVYDNQLQRADQKKQFLTQIINVLQEACSDSLSSTSSNDKNSNSDYEESFKIQLERYIQRKDQKQQKLSDQYNQYNECMNLNAKDQAVVNQWQAQYQLKQSQKQSEKQVSEEIKVNKTQKVLNINKKIRRKQQKN